MGELRALLIAILAVTGAGAGEIAWSSDHPCLRPGLLHRGFLAVPDLDDGRYELAVRVLDRREERYGHAISGLRPAQLATGIAFNWVPRRRSWSEPILEATLHRVGGGIVASRRIRLRTWRSLLEDFVATVAAIEEADAGVPLAELWEEQARLQVSELPPLGAVRRFADLLSRLRAWERGRRSHPPVPGNNTLALRCPVDGSIQPWRLHLPEGELRAAVLVIAAGPDPPRKDRWPSPLQARIETWRERGWAVAEVYPAGDPTAEGPLLRRAAATRAAAIGEVAGLGDVPWLACSGGRGFAAGLAVIASAPDGFAAAIHVRPRSPEPIEVGDGIAPEGDRYLREWYDLARDRAQLVQVPHFLVGEGDRRSATIDRILREAGGDVRAFPDRSGGQLDRELGSALDAGPPAVRRYRVWEPGRYGPCLVAGPGRRFRPGELVWEDDRVRGEGLLAVRLLDGHEVALARSLPRRPETDSRFRRGPLGAFGQRPFVVVLGTGRHVAEREANKETARAFLRRWSEFAQGEPPLVEDRAYRPEDHPGHDVCCIGDPRGNAVLAGLLDAGSSPLRWDGRGVRVEGRFLADRQVDGWIASWPHPERLGVLVVGIGGDPPWRAEGAPLRGFGDYVVRTTGNGVLHGLVGDDDLAPE